MGKLNRREFLVTASAATLAAAAARSQVASPTQRVFIGSGTPDGILAYDWNPLTAELTPAGVAARIPNVDWITFSTDRKYLFVASEVDSFNGKATGEVTSFSVIRGELHLVSAQNSAGPGTCHVALDRGGRVLLAADYGGGSAASFWVGSGGQLGPAVTVRHYKGSGPNTERQQSAHAHFASFSPDDCFAYINDLGGDAIHIYKTDRHTDKISPPPGLKGPTVIQRTVSAVLTPAGEYKAEPGSGPRTLHFHPNGHTAYSVNELNSTVDVLEWSKEDGSLTLVTRIDLLPEGYDGPTRACDTVISANGKFVYFANRDNNFLYSFSAEFETGKLTPMGRTSCGGKTPRNFVLDPTEQWMLVANQDSNSISVFKRDAETGVLAEQGKSFAAAAPMRILFS